MDALTGGELTSQVQKPNAPLPIAIASVALGVAHLMRTLRAAQLQTTPQVLAVEGVGVLWLPTREAGRCKGADEGLGVLVLAPAYAP